MKLKMNNLYFEDFKYPNDYFEIFILVLKSKGILIVYLNLKIFRI